MNDLENLAQLINYFNIKYQDFRLEHNYSYFEKTSTFSDEFVAQSLLSIEDQSYDYIFEYLNNRDYLNLYNTFSGSGRLIKEIEKKSMIEHFNKIYNIDNSMNMINFEKKFFSKYKNINYICEDFIKQKPFVDYNSLMVCHSGLRYVEDQFAKLINKLSVFCSYNNDCIISETSKRIIDLFTNELDDKDIKYSYIEKNVIVHRNTKLYFAYLLLSSDLYFKRNIFDLSKSFGIDISDMIIAVSGYKKIKQYLIFISCSTYPS